MQQCYYYRNSIAILLFVIVCEMLLLQGASPVGDDGDGRGRGLAGGDVDQEALAVGRDRILPYPYGDATAAHNPRLK
jgi:hypothetical protein